MLRNSARAVDMAAAACAQFAKLASYHTFNHRSNGPCVDLIEQLAAVSPVSPCRIFFANSGSEANDSMVKLAWYCQAARGRRQKRRIISRNGAFHGSTVILRNMGDVLALCPPYVIEPDQIDQLVGVLALAIEDTRQSLSF